VFFCETFGVSQWFLALKAEWIWCVAFTSSSWLVVVNVSNVLHEQKVEFGIALAPATLDEFGSVLLSNVKDKVLFGIKLSATAESIGALIFLVVNQTLARMTLVYTVSKNGRGRVVG
jgi:hypothetical protein